MKYFGNINRVKIIALAPYKELAQSALKEDQILQLIVGIIFTLIASMNGIDLKNNAQTVIVSKYSQWNYIVGDVCEDLCI